MKSNFYMLIVAGILSGTAGCAAFGKQNEAAPQMASIGQGLAQRQCGQCHAVGRSGASPLADAPPFAVLRARLSREDLAIILKRRMTEVHPRMPAFRADDDELAQLLSYWDEMGR